MVIGSGNFMVDQEDNEPPIKHCEICGSEDGLHYCLCNREISEDKCKQGLGCPDCR